MQYGFWSGVPKNVSRREYRAYTGRVFGAIMCFLLGCIILVGSVAGLFLVDVDRLSEYESKSIDELANWSGERTGPVKVEGMLSATDPPTVPGKSERKVLNGRLTLRADAHHVRGGTKGPQATLIEWEEAADQLVITDGKSAIDADIDPKSFQLNPDRLLRGKIRYSGGGMERVPEAVEFDGLEFPLEGDEWRNWTGAGSTISVDVELEVFEDRQTVTVVGDIDVVEGKPRLIAQKNKKIEVHFGTTAGLQNQAQVMRFVFPVIACGALFAGFWLFRSAKSLRAEFLLRSNQ